MYCKICGKNNIENGVCSSCESIDTSHFKNRTTSIKKIFFVIFTVIFLSVASTFAYGMFNGKTMKETALDLLFWKKSAKELYFQAEFKTLHQDIKDLDLFIGEGWDLQQHMLTNPYKNKLTLTGNFDIDGDEVGISKGEMQLIQLFLRGTKLIATTQVDPNNLKGSSNIELKANGIPLLSTELYQSKDKTAIQLPFIDGTYYFIQNDQYGKFMKQSFQAYNAPNTIDNYIEIQKSTAFSKEELMNFVSEYAQFFNEQLDEKNFSIKHDVAYNDEKLRQITIELTEEEIKVLLLSLINKLETNDKMLDVILPQLKSQAFASGMSEQQIEKEIESFFSMAKKSIKEEAAFPSGLKLQILIDDNEFIVSRDFSITLAAQDELNEAVQINYVSSNLQKGNTTVRKKNLEAFEINGEANSIMIEWLSKITAENKENIFDSSLAMTLLDKGVEEFDINFDIAGSVTEKDTGKELKSTYHINVGNTPAAPSINGYFNRTVDQNLNKNYSNNKMDVGITVELNDDLYPVQSVKVGLGISNDTTFTDELNFPTFNEANSVNLTELSPYELMKLMEKIQEQLVEKFDSFASFFNS